jgi:hypothetical protein
MKIHPDDAEKTTFVTRSGKYQFYILSMSLANAPSQFQRLMDLVLAGFLWDMCLVYLVNIIISSRAFDLHVDCLKAAFDRIAKAHMKLKASKCQIFRSEIQFLDHVVSAKGILPIQAKYASSPNGHDRRISTTFADSSD